MLRDWMRLMPDRRPLFGFPTWDGKIVLAGIFIVGYFMLVLRLTDRSLPETNIELVKDALLVLGPPIGLIFHALFRTTAAEERRELFRSNELQTAITTPSTIASASPSAIGDEVEVGARRGSRAGVEAGLSKSPGSGSPGAGGGDPATAATPVIE